MKKIISVILAITAVVTLSSCNSSNLSGQSAEVNSSENYTESIAASIPSSDSISSEDTAQEKILIAYFSWAENAALEAVDIISSPSVTAPGNVTRLASWIAEETGGDLFSIQVTEPYPADWDGCLNRANEEKANQIHPALSKTVETIADYDIIFLGYPNWWYSCPMAIFSFLDQHDLSGKQVYLFCSHGTGGLASSVRDIKAALPNTAVSDQVFHVYEDDTAAARNDIVHWISELNL